MNKLPEVAVSLFISELNAGGAQRVLVNLADSLCQNGYQVTVITLSTAQNDFYSLNSSVKRIELDLLNKSANPAMAVLNNLRRIIALRRSVNECSSDVAISFMNQSNILLLLAVIALPVKCIISERIHPAFEPLPRMWQLLRNLLYRRADCLVVQTEAIKKWILQHVAVNQVRVIPNFVNPPVEGAEIKNYLQRNKQIIAMGRLTHQKGFDVLIDAFTLFCDDEQLQDWQLLIYGDGEQRAALQEQIDKKQLQDRVKLCGITHDAFQQLSNSRIFVLSSRWEGFSNALTEAMSAGCAVLAGRETSGVQELIGDKQYGLTYENHHADSVAENMATVIKQLCFDDELASKLANKAKSVSQRFDKQNIMPLWQQLIDDSL